MVFIKYDTIILTKEQECIMKNKFLMILVCGVLLIGLTGCGNNNNNIMKNTDVEQITKLLGTWSGEETSTSHMCDITFKKDNKYTSTCVGVFNATYDFSGTYEITGDNTLTITSDETGKQIEYQYEFSEMLGKKYLSLISTTSSTKYEDMIFVEE